MRNPSILLIRLLQIPQLKLMGSESNYVYKVYANDSFNTPSILETHPVMRQKVGLARVAQSFNRIW